MSSEHHNEILVEQILKALRAEQYGDNRWRGLCPAHDDHTPSLDIYINTENYPGFNCLSRHCKHVDIVKAIKAKFNIDVPVRRTAKQDERIQSARVLYPAHEPTFPLHLRKDEDVIYEYVTSTGEPAFFVQRYMDGKHKQTPAWFSVEYVSDGGRVEKHWSSKDPPNKDRPLYNLYQLTESPDKPVLVVEGEKTAEAAMLYKELEGYVVTTWSGGSGRVKASDWTVLRDRNTPIYLWPDHDDEGVKAMKVVAKFVSSGPDDQRLNLIDYSEFLEGRIDKGWDLADGCANMTCDIPFSELWGSLKPYYVNEKVTSESLAEALAKRDVYYRKLHIGGTQYVIDLRHDSEQSPFGVVWFRDSGSLAGHDTEKVVIEIGEKTKSISVAREWCETRGSGPMMLYGTVFNPTVKEKELIDGDGLKCLNTFPGFKAYSSEGRHNGLVKVWLEHLDGMVNETDAKEWIKDYYADIFQNPARKPGTALVLLGGQGVGKSVLIHCVATLLGTKLTRIINKDILRNNIALSRSLLVIHDEWSINHYKEKLYYESLKNAITSPRLKIEEKYLPAWESDSFCRFSFTSNDAKPIRLPPDDRRFTIVHCGKRWLNNKEHFNRIFETLKDETALGGFLDFFANKKIVSDLTTSYNTKQKDELWEPENKVLVECIQWADGNGMPLWMQEILGPVTNNFGEDYVMVPRGIMREYITKVYGNAAYSNSDVAILKRVMPGPEFKRKISIFDKRGGESRLSDLCFCIPPLQEFRANIERELSRNYPWNDLEIKVDPDITNIIPIRRDVKDSPI